MNTKQTEWWRSNYGFFGDHYLNGDDSIDGYLINFKQTLIERTTVEVDGVVKLLQLKNNQRILDVPCGYGRHSIELAKRGFKVLGSDLNPVHLAKANMDAGLALLDLVFKEENMLTIQYDNEFDAVINMFYSFGFFAKEEDNFRTLQNFYKALKPGGKFLLHTDVNLPRVLSGKYKIDEERNLSSGATLRILDNYDSSTKRMNGSWIITDDNGSQKKNYSVRVYTQQEFIDLCLSVGFRSCESYSDWLGNPYSEQGEDMIIVAVK